MQNVLVFLSHFKHMGFRRKKKHFWAAPETNWTSRNKIKHLSINCDKKDLRCLSIMVFWQQRLSITALHLQPIVHMEGYFLALSFTVKSGRKVWLVFSVGRHFTTNLSLKDEFHQRNYILPLEWTLLGSLQ